MLVTHGYLAYAALSQAQASPAQASPSMPPVAGSHWLCTEWQPIFRRRVPLRAAERHEGQEVQSGVGLCTCPVQLRPS